MNTPGNVVALRARLVAAAVAPLLLSSCWSTEAKQETLEVFVEPGEPCPAKEEVPLGGTDSDRCHPGVIVSVDEGPRASDYEAYGGKKVTRCEYLATREKTLDPGNAFCLGSGRPLRAAGTARVAGVVVGEGWVA